MVGIWDKSKFAGNNTPEITILFEELNGISDLWQ
jgi:hypothetical protein